MEGNKGPNHWTEFSLCRQGTDFRLSIYLHSPYFPPRTVIESGGRDTGIASNAVKSGLGHE